jgi:hypothetical protein
MEVYAHTAWACMLIHGPHEIVAACCPMQAVVEEATSRLLAALQAPSGARAGCTSAAARGVRDTRTRVCMSDHAAAMHAQGREWASGRVMHDARPVRDPAPNPGIIACAYPRSHHTGRGAGAAAERGGSSRYRSSKL